MKSLTILTLGVTVIVTAGCSQNDVTMEDKGLLNQGTHQYYLTNAAEEAVIRQRTIFPYHFVDGTAELNDLGRRDIHTLALHFENREGTLHVRRGGASDALYEARVNTVSDQMTANGVSMGRGQIDDALPGGDGMTSERVLLVRDREPEWGDTDQMGSSSTNSLNR